MNKIYKLKYDRRRNQVVAVNELTAGAGKESTGQVAAVAGLTDMCSFRKLLGTLTPLAFLTGLVMSLLPGIALANPDLPTGGQIVAGQGSISTNGNQMTISQNTHGLVTNWNTFDVGQNHTVQFVQPDSSAVALNRVTGGHESQILGTLTANGQVMLVNPAGVMFGKGATVNTAGLVASTKNISNADFMAGHYTFSGGSDAGAEVVNQGGLTTTKGGFIVLAADRVKNSGSIRTPGGKTVLAAGEKVTLQLDNTGLASVSVSGSVVNALVENSGLLSATDGRVYLTARGKDMLLNTVVNNTGAVEASGLSSHGGEIVLNGGDSGVVSQSGTLLAGSKTGRGGKITVEGQNIHLAADSRTSATGKTGGGEVYVGGGWQGKDSHIRNASKVVMDKSTTIDVSATESGNGGTAVLWSDDYTNFRGTVLAKGAQAGNGGRVETSSHDNLQAFGDVDTSALAGKGGNWLLDPLDVTIVSGANNTNITEAGKGSDGAGLDMDTDHIFSPSATGAQVSAVKISEQLNKDASVMVVTGGAGNQSGNIILKKEASIKKTNGAGTATLTLKADKDINIKGGLWADKNKSGSGKIVATSGKLNLKLLTGSSGQDGDITLERFVHIKLNGGDFYAGPGGDSGNASMLFINDDSISAGNITLNTLRGTTFQFSALNADKDLTIKGPLSVTSQYKINTNLKAGGRVDIATDTGDISFAASTTTGGAAGGHILIDGKQGVNIQAKSGTLKMKVVDKDKNTISVRSDNGSVSLSGSVQNGADGLSLTNIGITSQGDTTLEGTTYWGRAATLSGLELQTSGNIEITGTAQLKNSYLGSANTTKGLTLSGSNVTSTGGNVSLTALSGSKGKSSLQVIDSNIASANSGKISLSGTTGGDGNPASGGVRVADSSLSAASLDVKGVALTQGTGFSLTNTRLLGGLDTLGHVTFSSAGSAAGVTNALDSSVVTSGNHDTLLAWHPENMTRIDMGGKAIFDDSDNDDKGWVADFSSVGTPNGGWIFDNTKVTAAGAVDLKGAGFTNSTITVSDGDFTLENNAPVVMNGDGITVDNGGINAHSLVGNVSLNGTNITAKNDVNLTADTGSVQITGGSSLNSTDGNIVINAFATKKNGKKDGVFLSDTGLSASRGGIYITGTTENEIYYHVVSGVKFEKNVNLSSTHNVITGKSVAAVKSGETAGVALYDEAHIVFSGNTEINAESEGFAGLLFDAVVAKSGESVEFKDGSAVIHAIDKGREPAELSGRGGGIAIVPWNEALRVIEFKLSNASLNITSESKGESPGGLTSFYYSGTEGPDTISRGSGFKFTGQGDVSIKGTSVKGDGVDLRVLNNRNLKGKFTVIGESDSGTGVIIPVFADVNVVNAGISGSSHSGVGILINATDRNTKNVNLQNNILNGYSDSGGAGVQIEGKNVSITNGTIAGTVNSGSGAGVILAGDTDYMISGATVTGKSVDGAGVSVSGNLAVNDNASIDGTATGKDAVGVKVSGKLSNTGDGKSTIHGKSSRGDAVQFSGPVELGNEFHVSGETDTGTAVNILGSLNVSEKTIIDGKAEDTGTGVAVGPDASVRKGTINAFSRKGTAFMASSGSTLDSVSVKGTTESGVGADIADLKESTGGTTITGEATGHGTSVQTEHGNGSRPDIVPPAPGGHMSSVIPDSTPPAGHDNAVQDTAAGDYIHEKQAVLSQPERLKDAVPVFPLERNDPVVVDICQDGPCRKLDVGTMNEPVRL
ncbi:filamentous hemagglutinin N-terminal domain-containing protein [Salmonella enterica]|nr:filamentous hemagglutinin N-terminal domain-containing protein [Salmonella enterica]EEG9157038.1 filamentous hemagglutinin N-terminal domain-containing protein [Salmonella enterica]